MPVIEIKALAQRVPIDVAQVMSGLCIDVAKVYGCSPGQVWATWTWIEPGHYVEGDQKAMVQPEDTHPPIVNITAFEGKSETEIKTVLKCISDSLSGGLNLDGNLFITYTEARSGRVFAGGSVLKK